MDYAFRQVTAFRDVFSLLEVIECQNNNLLVWQTKADKKYIFEGEIISTNLLKTEFEVGACLSSFDLDPMEEVYFYSYHYQVLFKTHMTRFSKHCLRCEVPNLCFASENRSTIRLNFENNDELTVTFSKPEFRLKHVSFNKKLFDLSEQGMAFRISQFETKHFFAGDTVKVSKFGSLNTDEFIFGRVNYLKRFYDFETANDFFRVGVVFRKKIDLEILNDLEQAIN